MKTALMSLMMTNYVHSVKFSSSLYNLFLFSFIFVFVKSQVLCIRSSIIQLGKGLSYLKKSIMSLLSLILVLTTLVPLFLLNGR